MRIKILGKYWQLKFTSLPDDRWGDCDPPDRANKSIRVSNKAKDKKELEVILHECDHAAHWHKDEEFVKQYNKDLADILWKLGYRRISNGKNTKT